MIIAVEKRIHTSYYSLLSITLPVNGGSKPPPYDNDIEWYLIDGSIEFFLIDN